MRGNVPVFQKTRLPWLRCNHKQTPRPRNRPRDRTTNFTERRNRQNSFTLTYHPQKLAIKNVILKNFKILRNDPETKHIFSIPPLISFKRDKNLGNFLVRSAFKFNSQPGTFTCKRTRCKTCPFISYTVKISGPNRSVKITDHFTCISTNVIYCITCTDAMQENLYRRNREKTGGPLPRTPTRRRKKQQQNQSRTILIFPITPTTTWLFAGYPYTTETQKAAKVSTKNSFFNWVHSLHTELMNPSHSTNLFTNSCNHISTDCKALLHSHINHNTPQFLYSLWRRANARNVSFNF